MTPRTDIIGLDIKSPLRTIISTIKKTGYSRIPVYENDIDHIKDSPPRREIVSRAASIKKNILNRAKQGVRHAGAVVTGVHQAGTGAWLRGLGNKSVTQTMMQIVGRYMQQMRAPIGCGLGNRSVT